MSALNRHCNDIERSRTAQRIAAVVDEAPVELDTEDRIKAALLATLPGVLRDFDDGRISGTPAAEARMDALLGVALSILAARPGASA